MVLYLKNPAVWHSLIVCKRIHNCLKGHTPNWQERLLLEYEWDQRLELQGTTTSNVFFFDFSREYINIFIYYLHNKMHRVKTEYWTGNHIKLDSGYFHTGTTHLNLEQVTCPFCAPVLHLESMFDFAYLTRLLWATGLPEHWFVTNHPVCLSIFSILCVYERKFIGWERDFPKNLSSKPALRINKQKVSLGQCPS